MPARLASAIGLVLLCALALVRVGRAPSPVPASAPDTVFSAERAMRHVEAIAVRPHALGMADHDRVRDYILAQLETMGLRAQTQRTTAIGTRYREAGRVENILAWLPGNTPNGYAVLLVAHYDGVEAGPAAADDGAGAAALLETLRALRARKQPLAHDIIVLFTDGEEAGLLGAAAFVREHPWAKDAAVALNFEARGTTGRSFMFETGPGNLDVARALRSVGSATAGSVFTTVYRALPNDTDLSELSLIGMPAMNFAFADGVERYHTSRDDVADLNPGSLQHHGAQMLALARTFANETLPRPRTGDAVFFDLPLIGLVVYSTAFAIPLAIVAFALVGWVLWRQPRTGIAVGVVTTIVIVALSSAVAWVVGGMLTGPAKWSGLPAAGIVLLVLANAAGCRAAALRWTTDMGIHIGALVVWLVLAVVAALASPGVSYVFVWPLLFAAAAVAWPKYRTAVGWIAAAITLMIVAGLAYGASVIMLGIFGMGAIALGMLSALAVVMLIPQLSVVVGSKTWSAVAWPAGAAAIVFIIATITVHPSAAHPIHTAIVYAENADSADAWLGTSGGVRDDWTRSVVGQVEPAPEWTSHIEQGISRFSGRHVARVPLDAPNATLARDTIINGFRRVVLRVTSPRGTTGLLMRAPGARVATASIDGRIIDTTRYRSRRSEWEMEYWAVPDSGAVVALSIPPGATLDLELAARRPGLPAIPGLTIPARPASVVAADKGDVSIVYRKLRF